jgi:hypothetical protein
VADQESVTLEVDLRSVLAAIKQAENTRVGLPMNCRLALLVKFAQPRKQRFVGLRPAGFACGE